MKIGEETVNTLMALGLSQLEAEVYVVLVQNPGCTGYRVAQQLGKAAAGVYKALDSLVLKGAVGAEDSTPRQYSAVSPEELLGQLDRTYTDRRNAAENALAQLDHLNEEISFHRLQSFDQVIERAKQMLSKAAEVVVVDVFPDCLEFVAPFINSAHARGVRVYVQLYREALLQAHQLVVAPDADRLLTRWKGSWLNIVVDAKEHLLSYLDCEAKTVMQAAWSNSSYLSTVYYNGITSELQLDVFGAALQGGATTTELRALWDRYLVEVSHRTPPGVRELQSDLHRALSNKQRTKREGRG